MVSFHISSYLSALLLKRVIPGKRCFVKALEGRCHHSCSLPALRAGRRGRAVQASVQCVGESAVQPTILPSLFFFFSIPCCSETVERGTSHTWVTRVYTNGSAPLIERGWPSTLAGGMKIFHGAHKPTFLLRRTLLELLAPANTPSCPWSNSGTPSAFILSQRSLMRVEFNFD